MEAEPIRLDKLNKEFEGVLNVHVPENPEQLASIAYCYKSLSINVGANDQAIGFDLEKSSTIITTFKKEKGI